MGRPVSAVGHLYQGVDVLFICPHEGPHFIRDRAGRRHVDDGRVLAGLLFDMASAGPIPDEMRAFVRAYKKDIDTLVQMSNSRNGAAQDVTPPASPAEDGAAPTFE